MSRQIGKDLIMDSHALLRQSRQIYRYRNAHFTSFASENGLSTRGGGTRLLRFDLDPSVASRKTDDRASFREAFWSLKGLCSTAGESSITVVGCEDLAGGACPVLSFW